MPRTGDIPGYARVSTADRDASIQEDRLTDAGAIRVFTDIASGARAGRPVLARPIDHAGPGDGLCVTRPDRPGRSLGEPLETVGNLGERGIHPVSPGEDADTSSASGGLVPHVFGAVAHSGRRLIAERTRDGIAAAGKRGKRPGRRPLPEGKVSAARKPIEAGMSPGEAAKQLDIGRATACRIARSLRDPRCSRSVPAWGNPANGSCDGAFPPMNAPPACARPRPGSCRP